MTVESDKNGQSSNEGPEDQRVGSIATGIPIGVGLGVALGLVFDKLFTTGHFSERLTHGML